MTNIISKTSSVLLAETRPEMMNHLTSSNYDKYQKRVGRLSI